MFISNLDKIKRCHLIQAGSIPIKTIITPKLTEVGDTQSQTQNLCVYKITSFINISHKWNYTLIERIYKTLTVFEFGVHAETFPTSVSGRKRTGNNFRTSFS